MRQYNPSEMASFAEKNNERIAFAIRASIFGALLVYGVFARATGVNHGSFEAAALIYGFTTLLSSLSFLWPRRSAILAYAFISMDVVCLAVVVLLLGTGFGLSPQTSATLPVSGLIYVILLYASMRYRPILVLYASFLFAASIGLGFMLFPLSGIGASAAHEEHLSHFQLLSAIVFVLVTAIVFILTYRSRRFLSDATRNAARAAALARYFSPDVSSELVEQSADTKEHARRRKVAVIFADIQHFTAMSENMDPMALGIFLSEFRSRVARSAYDNGGIIDKYIGDAVMAVFGAPNSKPDDADRALQCAMSMVKAVSEWSRDRRSAGLPSIEIAIGAHFGEAFVGIVDDGVMMEYTVLGDTVNVASRLSRLPRTLNTSLVVSDDLVSACRRHPVSTMLEKVDAQHLPGRQNPLDVYRLRQDQ
ncbi:adenylate/guanylate cyclase domain-containing protein [Ferrovibrio sp.]|uniref:adenylate/guanylate cyclase domain-containing protein n=1 Tax=Ferrovibrio sp. TaxID=1917215 RepID=UPI00311EB185